MKIIHTVESYLPERHGMSEVVRQISEQLVSLGHEVIICTSFSSSRDFDILNGVQVKQFKISGNLVDGIIGEKETFINYLLDEKFDVLTNFAAQQWATDLCFEILSNINARKFFVPTGFSKLEDNSFKHYYQNMTNWLKLYDSIIFLSQFYKDYEFAKSKGIENLHIIPNGASEQEFKSESKFNIYEYLKISTGNNLILHVGNFTGIKGHFEAIHIFRKSKLENAHLVLCGQNFFSPEAFNLRILISPLKCISDKRILHPRNLIKAIWNLFSSKKNIHFLALDRSNLIDAYRQASLVLFPSNLECSPIVLFESMASSIPILITDVGNAREIVSKYNVGYILPTSRNKNGLGRTRIDQAALLLKFIISEKSILSIKGVNGFKAWNSNYTWEKITKQYEKLYQKSL